MHESRQGEEDHLPPEQRVAAPTSLDPESEFQVPNDPRALAHDRDQFLQEVSARRRSWEGPAILRQLLPDRDDRLAAGLAVLVGGLALVVLLVVGSSQTGRDVPSEGPATPAQT
ncbi:MAG: hypothetical protein K0U64_00045 [Actinomycetia bacterium]|nr:hypothetical protein [Actinomycetes bacterium]